MERHLDQAIWKTGFLELQNNSAEVGTGEILEPQTVLDSTDLFGLPDDDAGYSPSVCTGSSLDKSLDVSSNYDPEAVVQSAWKSLPVDFQASWERGFLEPVFWISTVQPWTCWEKGSSDLCLHLWYKN